jgi:hypothetical protein
MKLWRSVGSLRLIRQVGVPPLIYHVGDKVTAPNNREESRVLLRCRPAVLKKSPLAIPEAVRHELSFLGLIWQGFISPSPQPLVKRMSPVGHQPELPIHLTDCHSYTCENDLPLVFQIRFTGSQNLGPPKPDAPPTLQAHRPQTQRPPGPFMGLPAQRFRPAVHGGLAFLHHNPSPLQGASRGSASAMIFPPPR